MTRSRKAVVVILTMATAGSIAALLLAHFHILQVHRRPPQPLILKGAVILRSPDVDKQSPISGVRISVAGASAERDAWSSSSGYFELKVRGPLQEGQGFVLQFRHPEYEPLDITTFADSYLYVARMVPIAQPASADSGARQSVISNITIRYTVKSIALQNVGSTAKTFRVVNTGNLPCDHRGPCSPDGKWKATVGSATFEAPGGNLFDKARVSCIAGPCPFTRIQADRFSAGGPTARVAILNWSDTTTFLFEAEVVRSITSEDVRFSYPVIFGQTLHFTVPADAEGVCIEADVDRDHIVFPLGPQANLAWASCSMLTNPDQTRLYRCELNPKYGFQ